MSRRSGAPGRYEEEDAYWADQQLTAAQRLPDSDLLKAVHAYTTDFYARGTENEYEGDLRSMNETALLAFSILLEEAAEHLLGETGDMVFVEGEDDEPVQTGTSRSRDPTGRGRSSTPDARSTSIPRGRKKQKTTHASTFDDDQEQKRSNGGGM